MRTSLLAGVISFVLSGCTAVAPSLPTVEPVQEQFPDLFDPQGCLIVAPTGDVDCGLAPAVSDVPVPDGHDAWQRLLGFVGPHYLAEPGTAGLVLLPMTIVTASEGTWSATGLIRNESSTAVGRATLTARLFGGDGAELAVVSAASPIAPIRPGEPAPFRLDSMTDAGLVARVGWSITSDAPVSSLASRAMELDIFWEQPFGDRERADAIVPPDPNEPPYPYLMAGGVTSAAQQAIARPTIVYAWSDEEGRVTTVGSTPVRQFTHMGNGVERLEPAGTSGFLIRVDDPILGPLMASGRGSIMLWAVSGNR